VRLSDLKRTGHWPTLLSAFLYFDFSFMVWTVLGPLGAQIGQTLNLSAQQKGLVVAVPILSGAVLRILLGLLVDRVGAKNSGIIAQLVVIAGLALTWIFGLPNYEATLLMGLVLGFAGASFAVALPQAGRWYPPNMQGVVMGLAGAGNIGVVLDSLLAPRLAEAFGWKNVFGFALVPALLVLIFTRSCPKRLQARLNRKGSLIIGRFSKIRMHIGFAFTTRSVSEDSSGWRVRTSCISKANSIFHRYRVGIY
jgi:MFS transporter, NNP family, nitrate/nitrite transporter